MQHIPGMCSICHETILDWNQKQKVQWNQKTKNNIILTLSSQVGTICTTCFNCSIFRDYFL
jgi:hypothetical protein